MSVGAGKEVGVGSSTAAIACTASAAIAGTASTEIVGTSSTEIVGTASTETVGTASAEIVGTASTETAGTASAEIVDGIAGMILEDIHPQGSSHATGEILRGRAAATYYSPADEENTMFNDIGAVKLIAKILDPLNVNHNNMVPSSKVTVKMNPNLGPILDNISQHYPAIKGIC